MTEMEGDAQFELQKKGGEFGVTTGRGRRCGWLDLVVAEHAARLCGFNHWAITKLDVLNDYKKIYVCTGYEIDGKVEKHFPASLAKLYKAKPVYEEFDGWDGWEDSKELVKNGYDSLPKNMKTYIEFIEKYTKIPASIISIGPKRSETIDRFGKWWN